MKNSKILFLLFLLFSTFSFAQENAEIVLMKAKEQATLENKNVMVFFHASWCGWCKKMEKKMNSEELKPLFAKNYVLASLDVQERGEKEKLENPGGEELMKKLEGENAGLPYFVFISKTGEVLANSYNDDKENLGCPSTEEEVQSFIEKIQKTSTLNEEQLKIIVTAFLEK